jgi:hypothetical protein
MKNRQAVGFVWFITLVALVLRLYPAWNSRMPLNDGGLFYTMINDLLHNHLSMPLFTTYNGGSIPFAYPPFAFYLATIIVKSLGVQTIDVVRLLPPILSVLSIPAIFALGRRLLKSDIMAAFAAMFFAFTPLAFDWQIMGGGLTRSLGQLFFILTINALYDFYVEPSPKNMVMVSMWAILTVYSHPESAEQALLVSCWVWIYYSRSKKMLIKSIGCAIIVAILTLPWWGTLLSRFGFAPIIAVFSSAGQQSVPFIGRVLILFTLNFADEPYLTLITVLGLIGLFIAFSKKQPFLPIWMLLALLIDSRSGSRFATIPLAMLAAIALKDAIIPAILHIQKDQNDLLDLEQTLLGNNWLKIFTGYAIVTLVISAYFTSLNVRQNLTVLPAEKNALVWLSKNTETDAVIVAITGGRNPLLDAFTEWLPAISERHVSTSAFGQEWLDGKVFGDSLEAYRDLQACANDNETCLNSWMKQHGAFTYIIFVLRDRDYPLRAFLFQSGYYQQVYEKNGVSIFQYKVLMDS